MNQDFLQQFRQQLATWIEENLATQRLPFQRLELCPRILTECGRFVPDLVLWINRDSQLAGSMVLLPTVVNEEVLHEGAAMSKALGLGHFTTWAAREVRIWRVAEAGPEAIKTFSLPPANQVKPEDFELTLEALLDELKIVTITTAPATQEYSLFYYVNLCLRTLQDLTPGLTESARLSGGQTAADEWLELAPIEKSWMSLWRILFLLWQKRLPPGLQPDRLEQVFHYAMADYDGSNALKDRIGLSSEESPLAEADAIRLHHLAGRMSQLDWPKNTESAIDLIRILLDEIALRYELVPSACPWEVDESALRVNTHLREAVDAAAIVAPRPYLAGVALISLLSGKRSPVLAGTLQALSIDERHAQAVATLLDEHPPDRLGREAKLLLLRKAWPNRRFDINHKAPVWLLDTIYLAGIVIENLTITLPPNWQSAPGAHVLWDVLKDSYRLAALSPQGNGNHRLLLSRSRGDSNATHIYRGDHDFELSLDCLESAPAATRFWLTADLQAVNYLLERKLAPADMPWSEAIKWGAYLYLNTQLGQYIWEICTELPELPGFNEIQDAVLLNGIPLPNETVLQDLSLSGSQIDRELPTEKVLEQDFASIWGEYPILPKRDFLSEQPVVRAQRKGKIVFDQIAREVFMDGIPRFPEYYLMDIYKPELVKYTLDGPLEYAEEFFDTVVLRSTEGSQPLEVSGRTMAEALVLASWTGHEMVGLPADQTLLEEILEKYRQDLAQLWDRLTRECRRVEPQRQSALKMAKKLWSKQGLPPKHLF